MNATEYAVMDMVRTLGLPVGAHYLSEKLKLPPASIGRVLSSLEHQGLLEKVSNKGRQLTAKGHEAMAEQDQLNSKKETFDTIIHMVHDAEKDKLLDILQARILLECHAAEMACKNATDEDIRRLNALMLEYIYEVRQHGIASEQNLRLHLSIAEMAGNQTILQLLKLILTNDSIYNEFSCFAQKSFNDQLTMHNKIVEAITNRDHRAAKDAMRIHLEHIGLGVSDREE